MDSYFVEANTHTMLLSEDKIEYMGILLTHCAPCSICKETTNITMALVGVEREGEKAEPTGYYVTCLKCMPPDSSCEIRADSPEALAANGPICKTLEGAIVAWNMLSTIMVDVYASVMMFDLIVRYEDAITDNKHFADFCARWAEHAIIPEALREALRNEAVFDALLTLSTAKEQIL